MYSTNQKLPNPYVAYIIRIHMANIQCPHCDRDIVIESGDYGKFDCPYCDKVFDYSANGKYAKPTARTVVFIVLALISSCVTTLFLFSDSSGNSQSTDEDDGWDGSWEGIQDIGGNIELDGVGDSIIFLIRIICSACMGLLTLFFIITAVRRYSEDVALHNSELL